MSQPKVFKVQLGQTIKSPAIGRCDVAAGTKGRAILLSRDFIACALVFTPEPHRGAFFVDQDDCLRHGLNPTVFYVGLIARMNTDMKGNPIDDSFRIEYIRLREQQYDKFATTLLEMPQSQTVLLSLVEKGSFSYVDIIPSTREVRQDVVDSINEKLQLFDVDQLFGLVVNNLARPIEEYEKLLNGESGVVTNTPAIAPAYQSPQRAVQAPKPQRPAQGQRPLPPPPAEEEGTEGFEDLMEGVDFSENNEPDEFGQ